MDCCRLAPFGCSSLHIAVDGAIATSDRISCFQSNAEEFSEQSWYRDLTTSPGLGQYPDPIIGDTHLPAQPDKTRIFGSLHLRCAELKSLSNAIASARVVTSHHGTSYSCRNRAEHSRGAGARPIEIAIIAINRFRAIQKNEERSLFLNTERLN